MNVNILCIKILFCYSGSRTFDIRVSRGWRSSKMERPWPLVNLGSKCKSLLIPCWHCDLTQVPYFLRLFPRLQNWHMQSMQFHDPSLIYVSFFSWNSYYTDFSYIQDICYKRYLISTLAFFSVIKFNFFLTANSIFMLQIGLSNWIKMKIIYTHLNL